MGCKESKVGYPQGAVPSRYSDRYVKLDKSSKKGMSKGRLVERRDSTDSNSNQTGKVRLRSNIESGRSPGKRMGNAPDLRHTAVMISVLWREGPSHRDIFGRSRASDTESAPIALRDYRGRTKSNSRAHFYQHLSSIIWKAFECHFYMLRSTLCWRKCFHQLNMFRVAHRT